MVTGERRAYKIRGFRSCESMIRLYHRFTLRGKKRFSPTLAVVMHGRVSRSKIERNTLSGGSPASSRAFHTSDAQDNRICETQP